MKTPLAWLNTTSKLPKLALASSGIGFAVVLMFMQIGFLNGLFDSAVQILRLLDADYVLLSPARYTVPSEQRFDVQFVNRVRSINGVSSVQPIYIDRSMSEIRVMGNVSRSIRAIGVPQNSDVFIDPEMNARVKQLARVDQAIVDRKSKERYGFEKQEVEILREQVAELSGKRVRFVDWVEIGTDFVYDGSLVLSDRAVEHFFPLRNPGGAPLAAVDLGLVRLDPALSIAEVQQSLREIRGALGPSVEIMSKEDLIKREVGFWQRNTPIGAIFTIGTIMGLFVGVIICYQILFTDITDHLPEFATLKAMGYGTSYFLKFVFMQSLYLSVFGFIPGWLVSAGLYYFLAEWTGLVMRLTPSRLALVFCLTLIMCTISGLLAVRKLISADPATLFK
ncbi:MAG: FtsX-like permease family protein [Pirellula sp.]|jgi:putative ABC transport system permease protein